MSYSVYLKRSVEKELDHLPVEVYDKIIKQLISLRDNPRPHGIKKLHGKEGYRIRVGDYRILYLIDDTENKVEIVSVAHRKEIYR